MGVLHLAFSDIVQNRKESNRIAEVAKWSHRALEWEVSCVDIESRLWDVLFSLLDGWLMAVVVRGNF